MGGKENYVELDTLIGGVDRLILYLQTQEESIPKNSLENVILRNSYNKSRLIVETLKEWINEDLPKYEFNKEEE